MSLNENGVDITEQNILTGDIPAGAFRCFYDPPLTIIQMSESLLRMFGYTREEIHSRFHDSFWEMIAPEDRTRTLLEVKRQLNISNMKEIQYRVLCKDGSYIWILDKGQLIVDYHGIESFNCILIDITKTAQMQQELRYALERYQIIMSQTNDIIFEWKIAKKLFTITINQKDKDIHQPAVKVIAEDVFVNSYIKSEDMDVFKRALEKIRGGCPYQEIEIRIIQKGRKYAWFKTRITTQFDNNKRPIRAVGLFMDIDTQKRQSQILQEKAERDTLTKLYNKGTSEALIEAGLTNGSCKSMGCIFIIDIDNFKLVNDTKGHMFGDAFLVEVTKKMQKLFDSSDIVGRIGGDEFIAFVKNLRDRDEIAMKASSIIQVFYNMKILNHTDLHISCSIGAALYPEHGSHFKDLYQFADLALYQAKRQGKNQFVIYDSALEPTGHAVLEESFSAVNEKIDSDEMTDSAVNMKIVAYVFRILYKTRDLAAALSSILEIVGLQFDVSRVYVFENSEDNEYTCNTYEWCNEGIKSELENLQCLPFSLLEQFISKENDKRIFYCADVTALPKDYRAVLEPQGIKSILLCAIMDDGEIKGSVGFDDCKINRVWNGEQIETLSFIAEVLSIFLLKQRAKENLAQEAKMLRMVLDNQSSWIYVVDIHSYKLLFINKSTKEKMPALNDTMTCYEGFYKRETPCDTCPVKKMIREGLKNCMMEIHNDLLGVWVATDASMLSWKGKEACLLACHDVTKYKEP